MSLPAIPAIPAMPAAVGPGHRGGVDGDVVADDGPCRMIAR